MAVSPLDPSKISPHALLATWRKVAYIDQNPAVGLISPTQISYLQFLALSLSSLTVFSRIFLRRRIMSGLPPPSQREPDVNRGSQLISFFAATSGVALIVLVGRVWARLLIRGLGWDDFFMFATWLCHFATTVVVGFFATAGGTRHLYYLAADPNQAMQVVKLNYIGQSFAIAALGLGKVSVALFIMRIVSNRGQASKWPRITLWGIIALTSVLTTLMILFTFVQCENPAALWDMELARTTKCWDPQVQPDFSIFGGSWFAFVDFVLAIWPAFIVWRLEMTMRKKISLTILLGLGLLSGISAAIKVSHLAALSEHSDLTWETYDLYIWTGIEIFIIILCGTIPTLKPIFDKHIAKPIKSLYGSSHGGSSGRGSSGRFGLRSSGNRSTTLPTARAHYTNVEDPRGPGHELSDTKFAKTSPPLVDEQASTFQAFGDNESTRNLTRDIRVTSTVDVNYNGR